MMQYCDGYKILGSWETFLSRTDSGLCATYCRNLDFFFLKKKEREPFSPMWQLQLLSCAFSQSWQKSQNNMINEYTDVK